MTSVQVFCSKRKGKKYTSSLTADRYEGRETIALNAWHEKVLELKHHLDVDIARLEKVHDRSINLARDASGTSEKEGDRVDGQVSELCDRIDMNCKLLMSMLDIMELEAKWHRRWLRGEKKRNFVQPAFAPVKKDLRYYTDTLVGRCIDVAMILKGPWDDPKLLWRWMDPHSRMRPVWL